MVQNQHQNYGYHITCTFTLIVLNLRSSYIGRSIVLMNPILKKENILRRLSRTIRGLRGPQKGTMFRSKDQYIDWNNRCTFFNYVFAKMELRLSLLLSPVCNRELLDIFSARVRCSGSSDGMKQIHYLCATDKVRQCNTK
jgi:hypothetical protein